MPDQGVRYVVTLDDINVTSGFRRMESGAVSAEASINQLRGTLASLGVGFGLYEVKDMFESAIKGASDYEVSLLRIKNVSKDVAEGAKNISFITSEAERLKIPLQEATDAYGKFLVTIANSGLAGSEVRKLHDEVLTISKVIAAPRGKMDAAVLDISKELAQGVLEARTLRQLERVFPQITPLLAEQMGLGKHALDSIVSDKTNEATATQLLSRMESSGKLTKSAINARVLLGAIDSYYDSIKGKLPETLNTVESSLNDLNNDWFKFKTGMVLDHKDELIDFFHELQGGIKWLVEHENDIFTLGNTLFHLGEIWLGYKVAVLAVGNAQKIYNSFIEGYIGETVSEVSATEARATAMNMLAASMERVALASESIAGISGLGASRIPLESAGAGFVASEGASSIAGATAVEIVGISAAVIGAFKLLSDAGTHGNDFRYDSNLTPAENEAERKRINEINKENSFFYELFGGSGSESSKKAKKEAHINEDVINKWNAIKGMSMQGGVGNATMLPPLPKSDYLDALDKKNDANPINKTNNANTGNAYKVSPPKDNVTGGRQPISINITVAKQVGIEHVEILESKDTNKLMRQIENSVSNIMQNAVTDAIIKAGGH